MNQYEYSSSIQYRTGRLSEICTTVALVAVLWLVACGLWLVVRFVVYGRCSTVGSKYCMYSRRAFSVACSLSLSSFCWLYRGLEKGMDEKEY